MSDLERMYDEKVRCEKALHASRVHAKTMEDQRDELREALAGIRQRALLEMEARGFNQDTDDSWLLDAIDEAVATKSEDR